MVSTATARRHRFKSSLKHFWVEFAQDFSNPSFHFRTNVKIGMTIAQLRDSEIRNTYLLNGRCVCACWNFMFSHDAPQLFYCPVLNWSIRSKFIYSLWVACESEGIFSIVLYFLKFTFKGTPKYTIPKCFISKCELLLGITGNIRLGSNGKRSISCSQRYPSIHPSSIIISESKCGAAFSAFTSYCNNTLLRFISVHLYNLCV